MGTKQKRHTDESKETKFTHLEQSYTTMINNAYNKTNRPEPHFEVHNIHFTFKYRNASHAHSYCSL